jgi:multicomponent Na+:H+ antiporter subunit F
LFLAAALIALAAMGLSLIRVIIGPTKSDRAVGLDAMTIISIGLFAYIAYAAGRVIYLDVAMVYALVSFLGVVALARYLERGI